MFFITTSVSPYDLGAMGLIFILAAGLLKLLGYMIKKRFDGESSNVYNGPCRTNTTECPLYPDMRVARDQMKEMFDIHCGDRALGKDGVPRWYFSEDTGEKIDDIHKFITRVKEVASSHFEHSSGRSDRITKKSMETYHQVCSLIDEIQKTAKIQMIKEEDNG